MDSTGESRDKATLHLGTYDDDGQPVRTEVQTDPLPSLEVQREAHDVAYEQPDQSDWVTCVLPPKGSEPEDGKHCRWADDGSDPASGRMTPKAIHVDACPHAASRYINFVPTPVAED